jgi:rhomboid protease GluP
MQTEVTRIAARSKKQAMEWSLVLASQGIEPVISEPTETEGWTLVVPARDSERAFGALRQYRRENRESPWRRPLPWPETHFDWLCFFWAGVLIFFHWAGSFRPALYDHGVMASRAVKSGEWWRVFTAITLHADVAHLAANLSVGILLLGIAMGRYGPGLGLLAAYLAGVCGNLASLWTSTKPFEGLGASGMVMGALGLLAAQSLRPAAHGENPRSRRIAGVGAAILLFILYGLSPGTDTMAHFGGFVSGLALGSILVRLPDRFCHGIGVNITSGLVLCALVAGTWWRALLGVGPN